MSTSMSYDIESAQRALLIDLCEAVPSAREWTMRDDKRAKAVFARHLAFAFRRGLDIGRGPVASHRPSTPEEIARLVGLQTEGDKA